MKEIKLLEAQIDKLNTKGFDLNAWKQYTVVLLSRIFGENNPKIKQVEKIEYDYSSWSLRDTSGSSEYLEACKKLGREILQASIDELKTFGLPEPGVEGAHFVDIQVIITALEEQLTISQYRKLKAIVNSGDVASEKKKALKTFIKSLDAEFSVEVLMGLLSNPGLAGKF